MHQDAKDTAARSSQPIRARSSLNCAHGDETPFPHGAVDVCPCVMQYAVYVCVDRVHLTVLMAFCGRRFKSGFSSSSSSSTSFSSSFSSSSSFTEDGPVERNYFSPLFFFSYFFPLLVTVRRRDEPTEFPLTENEG